MELLFGEKNSFLFFLICILIAAGITSLVYFKNNNQGKLSRWQKGSLIFVRFLSVLLLVMLLLVPIIKTVKKYVEKPLIVVAVDNSLSILSQNDSIAEKEKILAFQKIANDRLMNDYSVVDYTFGEEVTLNGDLLFNEKVSDYGSLISTVNDNYLNKNIGAVILLGDGNFNRGTNPVGELKNVGFPIYSVGVGDTSKVSDSRVGDIRVNRTAFLGNEFPVEIDLSFFRLNRQSFDFEIWNGETVIYSESIIPKSDDYFTSVNLSIPAEEKGLQRYQVKIVNQFAERNLQNNQGEFVINVLENKQKILILSEGPHPDLGAIKSSLENSNNYEVSLCTYEPYPADFNQFNLIVLNQIPSSSTSSSQLISKTLDSKIPYLLLVGARTYLPQLNQLNLGINIEPLTASFEEAQADLETDFEAFSLSEELLGMVNKYPPVKVPFAEYSLTTGFRLLFSQRIKNISTGRPLVALGRNENVKTGVIFGEGLWKWRLYNYYSENNHDSFDELISSVVQYLSVQENKDIFMIDFEQVYRENERVIFHSQVYNELFEPVNGLEVTMQIFDENGQEYNMQFDNPPGSSYLLDVGTLPVGRYHFTANVNYNEQNLIKEGDFQVMAVNVEFFETSANHKLLYQLAYQSGGKFYSIEETNNLMDEILQNRDIKPSIYLQTSLNEILNLKGLFFVLIFVFSVEWFLRKYWGIY